MRVIAGKFRSRTLKSLEGLETRPTYDRLKETLFNVLASAGMVAECAWADLFAGTGAVGIEALSRGATSVHFAESSSNAAQVLRQNLALAGTGGRRCGRARRSRSSAPVGQGRSALRRLLLRPSLPAARSLRRDPAHPGTRNQCCCGGRNRGGRAREAIRSRRRRGQSETLSPAETGRERAQFLPPKRGNQRRCAKASAKRHRRRFHITKSLGRTSAYCISVSSLRTRFRPKTQLSNCCESRPNSGATLRYSIWSNWLTMK